MKIIQIWSLILIVFLFGSFHDIRGVNSASAIDIDLTACSGTMVYSVVYDMVSNPSSYAGKIIKMKGIYGAFPDPSTGAVHRACIVMDATACCAQGIEFELSDDSAYPEPNTQITVIGRLDTYRNNDIHVAEGIDPAQYGIVLDICILREAELEDD